MSNRFVVNFKFDEFGPLNQLTENLKKKFGRSFGKQTVRYRHRGLKRKLRIVDFYRAIWNIFGIGIKFDFDPFKRRGLILICYSSGFLSYLPAICGFRVGHKVIFNSFLYESFVKIFGGSFIFYISQQRKINNLEYRPLQGSQFIRSPGGYGKINKKEIFYTWVKLPSGKLFKFSSCCFASLGSLKFTNYNIGFYKKAGFIYLLGFKPRVRGVAKNPVDHPHGGGEGKKSGKSVSMSPWGKLIKGKKTSSMNKKRNEKI